MRIIAGEFGGRRLKAPTGRNTRPTPDRVREALFLILAEEIPDARVVELFGGTGSLGLESLSRGAAHAVFLEKNRGALACLTANIETLDVGDRTTVHTRSAFSFPALAAHGDPFDLVFCDPPFRLFDESSGRRRLEDLLTSLPIHPGGLAIIEHRAGHLADFAPGGFALREVRKWGATGMAIYRRSS